MMLRGEIWWADHDEPLGSEPGYARPVLILQSNNFNRSRIATTIVVNISSNPALIRFPGNVRLSASSSGLSKDSVINVSQVGTIDKERLRDRVGRVSAGVLRQVEDGVRLVLNL